jgi:hypothetical protein
MKKSVALHILALIAIGTNSIPRNTLLVLLAAKASIVATNCAEIAGRRISKAKCVVSAEEEFADGTRSEARFAVPSGPMSPVGQSTITIILSASNTTLFLLQAFFIAETVVTHFRL